MNGTCVAHTGAFELCVAVTVFVMVVRTVVAEAVIVVVVVPRVV